MFLFYLSIKWLYFCLYKLKIKIHCYKSIILNHKADLKEKFQLLDPFFFINKFKFQYLTRPKLYLIFL